MSETTENKIRHFRSEEICTIKSNFSPDMAAKVWLELNQKIKEGFDPCYPEKDALSKNERDLYDGIVGMLISEAYPPMIYSVTEKQANESSESSGN